MGSTLITYVSKTVAGTQTVTLGTHPVLTNFRGWPMEDTQQSISRGGKAVSVVFDAWHEYDVELRALPITGHALHSQLFAWLSHAQGGGEFVFTIDSDADEASTLSGAEAAGQTVLSVTATAGFSAADWVYIEDLDDPTVFQRVKIQTVDSGVQVTIEESLKHSFVALSPFRHAEHFPSCVLLKQRFRERAGGKGANLWDLEFKFRTVR